MCSLCQVRPSPLPVTQCSLCNSVASLLELKQLLGFYLPLISMGWLKKLPIKGHQLFSITEGNSFHGMQKLSINHSKGY